MTRVKTTRARDSREWYVNLSPATVWRRLVETLGVRFEDSDFDERDEHGWLRYHGEVIYVSLVETTPATAVCDFLRSRVV